MKLQAIILFAGFLLFNYQNCSVNNAGWNGDSTTVSGTATGTNTSATSGTVKFGESSITQVNFYEGSAQFKSNGKVADESMQFAINFSTGEIHQINSSGQAVGKYCLTEDLKNELSSVLYSSTVCRNNNPIPEGTVCAEVFKMPYAEIVTSNEVYPLGSAANSCGLNSVDLCGEYPNMLKGWYQSFKAQTNALSCPVQ